MSDFLFETHAHTSEVSGCARIPAEAVVKAYINARYDGMVITDHMSCHSVDKLTGKSWNEKIDFFVSGYNAAVKAAAKLSSSFTVLFGMELRFHCDKSNDYLVYGISEEFLRGQPGLLDSSLKEFRKVADKNGLLIFQAHPFRCGMVIADYRLLDGAEVYNGNSSHNSNNDIANIWAEKYNLRKSSGSDFHGMWGMAPGGIRLLEKTKSNEQLAELLRTKKYRLK